ncbi:AmmeMemoRadiSam system protein A [bacterium]|jgi:AmmeMemoRadiSam system protein A|nr:AmmeMemoRadiSam system protein A [bacterium]
MSVTEQLKKDLISLAKTAINDKLNNIHTIDVEGLLTKYPNLSKIGATFVTLTIHGELRGCMGVLIPHQKLLADIIINAQKAAFEDPRFTPLTQEEFKNIEIEISILSENLEIKYENLSDLKSKINIGVDGVIIRQGEKRATFLPHVWEQLPDFNDFLTHLFHKAGITDLDTLPDVFVYHVDTIK